MFYSLKNVGCTYQRAMQEAFFTQIGNIMDIYIDDWNVKTKVGYSLIPDLTQIFENLHQHKIMLNLGNCIFGVEAGKILGFLVPYRVIEANLKKVKASRDMPSPINVNQVQKLAGSMITL